MSPSPAAAFSPTICANYPCSPSSTCGSSVEFIRLEAICKEESITNLKKKEINEKKKKVRIPTEKANLALFPGELAPQGWVRPSVCKCDQTDRKFRVCLQCTSTALQRYPSLLQTCSLGAEHSHSSPAWPELIVLQGNKVCHLQQGLCCHGCPAVGT